MATPVAPASAADDGADEAPVGGTGGDTGASDDTPTPAAEGAEGAVSAAAVTDDTDDEDAGDLVTPEELARIKADPALKALYKNLHKGFTTKTQKLAGAQQLAQALQTDPVGTVQWLAQQAGLRLADQPKAPDVREGMRAELANAVGDDLAERLLPVVEKIAGQVAQAQIGPIQQRLTMTEARGVEETAAVVQADFEKRHPDFKQHEKKMMEVAQRFRPVPGADASKYLDDLYTLATAERAAGKAAGDAVDRLVEATARGGERPSSGTPGSRVTPGPPSGFEKMSKGDKLRASLAAAKRGERWE
jgi:hypothetical protein